MKILMLNDYGTPTAGAELITLRLRDSLRASGHEVRVLASRARLIVGPRFADSECFGTTGRLQPLSALANPLAARALSRELQAFRPDVVHVNMFMWQLSPSILPQLRSVPSVYYAMIYKDVCPTGLKRLPDGTTCNVQPGLVCLRARCLSAAGWGPRMLQLQHARRGWGAFERVIAVSTTVRERLQEAGISVDDVVWPGVPETPPNPGPGARPTVTYAGRLVEEKGVGVLLRALRLVLDNHQPAASLLVAGTGPEGPALRALAGRLGLDGAVTWLGQLNAAEITARFADAWVHAVPSVWAEPFGMTATEAMMRGTPAVVSAIGGLADTVVHGETGFQVPPDDVRALAAALGLVLADRRLAAELGVAARAHALEHLTLARSRDRLLTHYRQIVA